MTTFDVKMQPRLLPRMFHIDTNLINARGKLETMNQIERWAADEVILINMSGTSYDEARAGHSSDRTRKANTHIFTIVDDEDGSDVALHQDIEAALFPGGCKDSNQRNDVQVVFEATKYGAILITLDGASKSQPGGILGNREKLRDMLTILSDIEAVAYIRKEICKRDEMNRRIATEFGLALPEWTGQD